MKKIYFLMNTETGYKCTGCMFTNKRACQKYLEEKQEQFPDKKYEITIGYAFSK